MSDNDDTNNVSTEEVKDFLKSSGVVLEGVAPEDLGALQKPEAAPKKPADTPRDTTFDEDMPTQSAVNTWAFLRKPGKLPEVEVPMLEREMFLKAALTDARFKLDIPVASKIKIRCNSLTDWEKQVLFSTLAADIKREEVVTDEDYYSRMQTYGILLQVRSVDAQPFKYALEIDADQKEEEAMQSLRDAHACMVKNISAALREMCLKALYVFHVKLKILTDNLVDENFWKPQDAG